MIPLYCNYIHEPHVPAHAHAIINTWKWEFICQERIWPWDVGTYSWRTTELIQCKLYSDENGSKKGAGWHRNSKRVTGSKRIEHTIILSARLNWNNGSIIREIVRHSVKFSSSNTRGPWVLNSIEQWDLAKSERWWHIVRIADCTKIVMTPTATNATVNVNRIGERTPSCRTPLAIENVSHWQEQKHLQYTGWLSCD